MLGISNYEATNNIAGKLDYRQVPLTTRHRSRNLAMSKYVARLQRD
jgi:hypothetical protein